MLNAHSYKIFQQICVAENCTPGLTNDIGKPHLYDCLSFLKVKVVRHFEDIELSNVHKQGQI